MSRKTTSPDPRTLAERSGPGRIVVAAVSVWSVIIGAGFLAMAVHSATPGGTGRVVARWPVGSRLLLSSLRPTLVMAVHPRCPCTRASISELAHIMTRCAGRVEVYILIYTPTAPARSWAPTDAIRRLGDLRGVHVIDDPGGVEAGRFGAETSGHVALFASGGRLLFRGGITPARDHEGDNDGRRALLDLISGGSSALPGEAAVFGCPILPDPSRPPGRAIPWID